jgi:hypothetical protein
VSGEEEKIAATKSSLLFGILMITVWIAVGTAAFWVINSLFGWLFLGFSVFSILIVMRRQMCGSCYYCASCTKGFAKLSRLFLGGSHIPGISKGSTWGMTLFIYMLLSIIPGTMLASSILYEFRLAKLVLLICLLSISIYNATVRGKKLTH